MNTQDVPPPIRAVLIDAPGRDPAWPALVQGVATGLGLAFSAQGDPDAVAADTSPALVLLGPHLDNPLALARRVHRSAPLAYLVFVAAAERVPELRRALRSVAMVGKDWRIVAPDGPALEVVLAAAAQTLRRRGQLRATLDRVNATLANRSALKNLEESLAESQQLLGAIVDNSSAVIYVKDLEGRYLLVNHRFEELFHVTRLSMAGKTDHDLFSAEQADALRAFDRQVLAAGRTLEAEEVVDQDDGLHTYVSVKAPIVDPRGEPYAICGISTDITERKKLEDRLRDANEQLELRVEQRTAELLRAKEALEHSNLELRQFAYIASHDLQSPLRSISGFVQLLQADCRGRLDPQADQWILRVVENVQRMQTLIHDLLAYSRVESRARPFEPVDFHQVFHDAVGALDTSILDAGARVGCGDLPTLMGDRSQLVQLLQNLIENGIKYHRADVVPEVHVSAARSADGWLFSVRDNGIGIAARHCERIFELFQRLHTQQAYPGTGIGLAICRRVVERHGGHIWAESEPGRGSIFHFTLPLREEEKS